MSAVNAMENRLNIMKAFLLMIAVVAAVSLVVWPWNGLLVYFCAACATGPKELRRLWWERAHPPRQLRKLDKSRPAVLAGDKLLISNSFEDSRATATGRYSSHGWRV